MTFAAYLRPVQKRLVGSMLLLLGLNWLIKPVWIFLVERETQNFLGEEAYGRYFVVYNLSLLFVILLDFGINNNTARQVAADKDHLKHFSGMARVKLWLSGLYFVALVAAGYFQQLDMNLVLILGFNQILIGFIQYFRAVLQGLHLFRTDSIISVLDRFVALSLFLLFLLVPDFRNSYTAMAFALLQTAGYLSSFVVGFASNYRQGVRFRFQVSRSEIRELFRKNLPYALLTMQFAIFSRVDAVLLRHLHPNGFYEAGLYAQSFRLLDAALIFSGLISGMLLPVFSAQLAKKEDIRPTVFFNARFIIPSALFAFLIAVFWSQPLMEALYHLNNPADAQASATVFLLLMAALLPMAAQHIYGTLLTAAHDMKLMNRLALATALINIALNAILIPEHGAIGAAFACFAAQAFFSGGCFITVYRRYGFRFRADFLLKSAFVLVAAGLAGWFLQPRTGLWTGLLLTSAVFGAGMMATGLLNVKSLLKRNS